MDSAASDVRVHLASFNTAAATELTIRTMRAHTVQPFALTVGDCGSTDASIEMLQAFAARGVLDLEIAPNGRMHGEWLDQWFASCAERYVVFSDSDVEYRRTDWLAEMLATAHSTGAALVATRIQARDGVPYRHPTTGAECILAARPEPWLMLIDAHQVRGVLKATFTYEETKRADGTTIGYDVGAAFFRDLTAAGLSFTEMPASFARSYRHFGGLTWQRRGIPLRRQAKQLAKRAYVFGRLRVARGADRRREGR